jgi:hypothetical protein
MLLVASKVELAILLATHLILASIFSLGAARSLVVMALSIALLVPIDLGFILLVFNRWDRNRWPEMGEAIAEVVESDSTQEDGSEGYGRV